MSENKVEPVKQKSDDQTYKKLRLEIKVEFMKAGIEAHYQKWLFNEGRSDFKTWSNCVIPEIVEFAERLTAHLEKEIR